LETTLESRVIEDKQWEGDEDKWEWVFAARNGSCTCTSLWIFNAQYRVGLWAFDFLRIFYCHTTVNKGARERWESCSWNYVQRPCTACDGFIVD
jgi:hypothetical protein